MTTNEPTDTTGVSNATDRISRRTVLKGASGVGAVALAFGTGAVTSGAAQSSGGIPTPWLDVNGNLVEDQAGNTVTLRGVNIADPRRMAEDPYSRGKNAVQAVDYLTNEDDGWYSRVIRIPCHPWDIAGLPSVWVVRNELSEDEHPDGFVCPDGDCEEGHYEPPIFTEPELETYLEEYLDPVVERCRENGVYCIVDFHRHWGAELYWADPDTGEPNAALSEEVELFWDAVAPRYADESHVLYEVYNEPTNPGMWDDPLEQDWAAEPWEWWLETAQPWVDLIREHASRNVVIIGNPGWTQSPEGALLEPFDGDNLAYAYHIYAQHDVSQQEGWDEAGPNGDGTKRVYEEYPLFVTEWGWNADQIEADANVVADYGDPFLEWMESSDAIHWQAWNFDAGWGSEFAVRPAFDGDECAEPPCEWELVPGEQSLGHFVKDALERYRDDGLPEWDDSDDVLEVNGYETRDSTGDGLHNDFDGDGQTTHDDVSAFFESIDSDGVRNTPDAFDFDGDGDLGFGDVVQLLRNV